MEGKQGYIYLFVYLGRFGHHDIGFVVMDLGLFGFGYIHRFSWFLGMNYRTKHSFTVGRNFEHVSFLGS